MEQEDYSRGRGSQTAEDHMHDLGSVPSPFLQHGEEAERNVA
jgi:hypothetical protein